VVNEHLGAKGEKVSESGAYICYWVKVIGQAEGSLILIEIKEDC
jgi:hypothetical protein